MTSGENAVLPQETKVGNYTAKKLPLIGYVRLLSKLDSVPSTLLQSVGSTWQDINNKNSKEDNNIKLLEILLKIVSKFPAEIIEIVALACDIEKEVIENDRDLGLDGLTDLLIAIYEVNNLQKVFTKLKKKLPEKARKYLAETMKAGKTG